MKISCKCITAFVLLVWWLDLGVQCILTQTHPTAAQLVQNLQSEQTTDNAKKELLELGKSDLETRQYLTVHLPPLIQSGPGNLSCSAHRNSPSRESFGPATGSGSHEVHVLPI